MMYLMEFLEITFLQPDQDTACDTDSAHHRIGVYDIDTLMEYRQCKEAGKHEPHGYIDHKENAVSTAYHGVWDVVKEERDAEYAGGRVAKSDHEVAEVIPD